MKIKYISGLLIISFLSQIIGCYSYQEVTIEEITNAEEYLDLQVITKNQYMYEFDEGDYTVNKNSINGSGRFVERRSIKPKHKDFSGSISFDDIESFKFDKFNTVVTILGIAIIGGIIALIISGISPSLKGFGGSGSGNAL